MFPNPFLLLGMGSGDETTVNREYFDVKIFSDNMACAKIKRLKYMRNINDNAVQGCLFENYLTRNSYYRMKYFRHEIFAIYGISNIFQKEHKSNRGREGGEERENCQYKIHIKDDLNFYITHS